MSFTKNVPLVVGVALAVALGAIMSANGFSSGACWTAGVTLLCAVWWTTEAIPLPATALVPLAVLPLAGVITHQQAAAAYGDTLILLMLAGSMIATALEKSEAHRQVALLMVRFYGNLWQKRMSKLAALRDAQLWMLHEVPKHPELLSEAQRGLDLVPSKDPPRKPSGLSARAWAGFVLSGDWR